jgi:hypothetical protein
MPRSPFSIADKITPPLLSLHVSGRRSPNHKTALTSLAKRHTEEGIHPVLADTSDHDRVGIRWAELDIDVLGLGRVARADRRREGCCGKAEPERFE